MNIIRIFIVLASFFYCAWYFFPYLPIQYAGDLDKLLGLDGFGATVSPSDPVLIGMSILIRAIATVGLFFYARWAFMLFSSWVGASILWTALGGIFIHAPLDATVHYVGSLLDGILLSLAYRKTWQGQGIDETSNTSLDADASRRSTQR